MMANHGEKVRSSKGIVAAVLYAKGFQEQRQLAYRRQSLPGHSRAHDEHAIGTEVRFQPHDVVAQISCVAFAVSQAAR